ncbi:Mbov_0396 family ICE element transmembrane protein [Metamycoplasma buccale]|uniref:Mbov_0396 family ICE element transmembrane protein n=1 Tax=Metamycoplasma buccale TaxID=55602 RepID=UPI00398F1ED9
MGSNIFTIALSPVLYLVFSLFWGIFISFPFLILQGLFKAARFFGFELLNLIIFQVEPSDYTFSFSKLPIAFLAFLIYGLLFTIIFIIFSFIKYQLAKRNKNSNMEHLRFKNVLRASLSAFLWALLLPFMIFILNLVSAIVFKYFTNILQLQSGTKADVISQLYASLNSTKGIPDDWVKDSVEKGQFAPLGFDIFLAKSIPSSLPVALIFIKNMVVAWMCLIILGAILVDILRNSLMQFTLFLISPLVAAKSIDDNGKSLMNWKNAFIQSAISIFLSLLSLNFFIIFILVLDPIKTKLSYLQIIGDLVIYIGAAYATKSINKLIGDILDIQVSNFGFKKAAQFIRGGVKLGTATAAAGAAVASGGATLGATLAKGGFANTVGGLLGKATNLSKVANNKGIAKSMGMSKDFIKSTLASVGKNKPLEQKKILDSYKTFATDKSGILNKNALKDLDSLKSFKLSQIEKEKEILKRNAEAYKVYTNSNADSYLEQKRARLRNIKQEQEHKLAIAKYQRELEELNNPNNETNTDKEQNTNESEK